MGALSLRARAVLGGAVWILFAVGLSGYLLLGAFDGIAERILRAEPVRAAGSA
jgi:hypothetical protein